MANKSIQFAGGNNITLSTATAANVTSITISGPNAGGAQTGISGISNSETMYTSGTVRLSGTNNVTVFSTTGQAYVISGPNTHAEQTALSAVYDGANSISSGTIRLTNANNVTFTINGQTLSGSVHAQQTGLSGLQNTETTYTSGTVELEGTNNITVFSTTGQRFRISGANTHAQQTAISALYDGANSISSGTVRLTNANNVTFTINGQTLSGSVHAQQTGISGIQNTETTYTSGTVELEGTNNITVFSTTGQRFRISGANTHAQQTGISGVANSQTTYTSGTVSLSDLANITIRSTTGNQFQFSVHAPETAMSAGVSNLGNTGGDTTVNVGSRLVFRGSDNVTLSQSTGAGATTIGINAAGGGAGQFSAGVSNLGNTAGSTGVTGTRVVLVGTENMTLSQSTDANGATISIIDGPNLDHFVNFPYFGHDGQGAMLSHVITNWPASIHVSPLLHNYGMFPGRMTANTLLMRWSLSGSTATMSQANTTHLSLGIYTRTGSTLSLLNSATTTWGGGAATNNSTSTVGVRWLTLHSSLWSAQPVFTQGHYYFAWGFRTSGVLAQTGAVFGGGVASGAVAVGSGTMGAATSAGTSQGNWPWYGIYGTSSTNLPGSIGSAQLNKSTGLAGFVPLVILNQNAPETF